MTLEELISKLRNAGVCEWILLDEWFRSYRDCPADSDYDEIEIRGFIYGLSAARFISVTQSFDLLDQLDQIKKGLASSRCF